MHFVADRKLLMTVIERAAYQKGARRSKARVRLTALAPFVYVEGAGLATGLETLVFRDGTCLLPAQKLVALLTTYYPKVNVTFAADQTGLRVERFEVCPEGFSFKAVAPPAFQIVTADAWLAPKGPVAPPSANVPSAAPDETTQPPGQRQRW